jgi:membrane protein
MVDRVKIWIGRLNRWSLRHRSTRIARRAGAGFMQHEALQYAGSMAYFAVLSIFQLLVLGVVVFSFFLGDDRARTFVLEQVQAGSPLDPKTINGVIDAVIESRGGITIVSGGFLFWSALGVFSSLSGGIERAFGSAKARPFLQDKLIGLLLMAVTGVLAVASLLIGIVTGIAQQAATDILAAAPGGDGAIAAIGLVVPAILIFVAFAAIYRIVPNRHVSLREVWPGALVAALLWTVLRFGFTYYVTQVAHYDSAFGPISTGVTLLVFLYFASVIVLLGAEVSRASVAEDVPVPVPPLETTPPVEAPAPDDERSRRPPRWVLVLGALLASVLADRFSKRDRQ